MTEKKKVNMLEISIEIIVWSGSIIAMGAAIYIFQPYIFVAGASEEPVLCSNKYPIR
jgi:hypothetical protein